MTTSETNLVNNLAGSNTVVKVNTILLANTNGTANAVVNVKLRSATTSHYLAYQVEVPAKSTLVLTSKDTSFYIVEGDYVSAWATVAGYVDIIMSYETIG